MKSKFLLFYLLAFFSAKSFKVSAQAVNVQDSLALVDLYDSTGGPNWVNSTNWLTTTPVSTWYGITIQNGRVSGLSLGSNKLVGKIPASIGNLDALFGIAFSHNQLSGTLPSALANLSAIVFMDFQDNQLSGNISSALINLQSQYTINLSNNHFTFSGIEGLINAGKTTNYYPQADIPLNRNGNILSVGAGGTLSNNTYKWYSNGNLIATKTGDSTLSITTEDDYSVTITNTIANLLTLYSIDSTNKEDSLVLVDLYNNTNGPLWTNNHNWLTPAPVGTWYGVTVRMKRVHDLLLQSNNLNGNIPSSIGTLDKLADLGFYDNKLNGSIPESIVNLSSLGTISFEKNLLTGSIPPDIGNLSNLTYINFASNQLTGTIPSSLADISNLFDLRLFNNQLSGTIPAALGKLSKLSWLLLYNNQLNGAIPDSLTLLSNLTRLIINDNKLSGPIPDSISTLTQLSDLVINNNQLSGTIPLLAKTNAINNLNISNNKFTFNGMENLPPAHAIYIYAPQSSILLNKQENLLSVSAGGTLANNTFRLYKDGALGVTQIGDSTFSIADTGKYFISVTNIIATQLTLYSDTITVSIRLVDTTTTITQAIAGTSTIDINNGIFKLISLTPTPGGNTLSGNVTTIVTIDSNVSTFHNLPYVQRHYDITPAVNAATAQSSVTLYFTQQDFDNFNNFVTANNLNLPLLPSGGVDNGNVRITQLHGSFTASPDPANYDTSNSRLITPNVTWDALNQWWVVSFSVDGFSGFFLSTANITLPLSLIDFKGVFHEGYVALNWVTANEVATKQFVVQRGNDGKVFSDIGIISAVSTATGGNYQFNDLTPSGGNNFYRLKMVDIDGRFSFSPIIKINSGENISLLKIYPNPSVSVLSLQFALPRVEKIAIEITDAAGKSVLKATVQVNTGNTVIPLNIQKLSAGVYYLNADLNGGMERIAFVKK